MNRILVYGLTCVLLILGVASAEATTIVLPNDEQLIAKSPVIVEGNVLSSMTVERDGAIWTDTVVSVSRQLKGKTDAMITIRELGGELDERVTKIYGAPEFEPGERVMLFLEPAPRGGYRTMDLFVGKFAAGRMADGRRLWLRDDFAQDATLLDAGFRPLEPDAKNVQREAAGFEAFIADRVAGRRGARNYAIENPVLAPGEESGGLSLRSEFTLISEPTLYRWFAFDDGMQVPWYHSGTQPGYDGGGLTELRNGMAPWTSYTAAKIRYAYVGTLDVAMKGLEAQNSRNEVLFNDPLDEVAGTFDRSTGGVVGVGGFNGVTAARSWTAPFTADASHTAGSKRPYNIVEGNLTIQNGVTPANGISSATLAEILAHEFGHTLGFGHSEDTTALMYKSVTRLGASLRADDQVAARWLYPNGSGGTTEPPPPPVTPAVVASFDASATSTTTGTAVAFTDRSSGSPTSWLWTFGDGATSASRNPSHAYASAGTYTVTLKASNATSSSQTSKQITVAAPVAGSYRTLVSVATQTGGVGGTSWRTELSVFNAGDRTATVSILFLPSAGGSLVSRSISLAPRQSAMYANALLELFGIASGAGALTIDATAGSSAADLRVSSRTFTTGATGTYGQAVPNVAPADLERSLYLTGLAASSRFRTNVGLVNRAASPLAVSLSLHDQSGATLATRSMTLAASSFQQLPLGQLFPQLTGASYDVLSMRLTAVSRDSIAAYASVVDNATQDPVYIQAMPAATGGSLTIPVVGRAPGANGTFWRSDVALFKPSASRVGYTLRYGGASKSITVDAGDTALLADIVGSFGMSAGNGALSISWSGSSGPVVTSRTYTTVAGGGTFGQSIDPVASFASVAFVPGLRNDASYRSNLGFVNGGASSESFAVVLLSPSGKELGRKWLTLAPNALAQHSVASLFPGVATGNGFTLQVAGDADAKLFAYGSMVDNRSGDPVFFAGR